MPGNLQPLVDNQRIVDANGLPTQYFIRWAQQRQIDISGGITAAGAQQLIDDWAASRSIIAGIALHGGGTLAADRTIDHDASLAVPGTYGTATKVPRLVIDAEGHVQGVTEVPISGGGGGGAPWWLQPPTAASLTLMSGDGTNLTLSDDTDVGLCVDGGTPPNNDTLRGAFVAQTPANDFTLTAYMKFLDIEQNYRSFGLALYDSGAGRTTFLGSAESGHYVQASHWNGLNNYNSTPMQRPIFMHEPWFRWRHTGGNYIAEISPDGKNWTQVYSEGDTSWLSNRANYIGIYLQNNVGGGDMPNRGSVPFFKVT